MSCDIWIGGYLHFSDPCYGFIMVDGKRVRAHRYMYEKWVGKIPKGYLVHHTCGNTMCVKIEHLKLVTRGEHNKLHPERNKRSE